MLLPKAGEIGALSTKVNPDVRTEAELKSFNLNSSALASISSFLNLPKSSIAKVLYWKSLTIPIVLPKSF